MLTTNMDAIGGHIPTVLNQQAQEEKGEMARLSSFVGAIAVADLVKTTLGPKGMVKFIQL
jgi:T-complex protein 1 subunit beta